MKRNRLFKTAVCLFTSVTMILTAYPAGASNENAQTESAVSSISEGIPAESTSDELKNETGSAASGTESSAAENDSSAGTPETESAAAADSSAAAAESTKTAETAASVSEDTYLEASDAGIADGYYTIVSKLSTSAVLQVEGGSSASGANINIGSASGLKSQIFSVKTLGSGLYSIENVSSKMVLDAAGAGTVNFTNVQQYQSNGTVAQQWKILDAGNGYCTIAASYCSKVLDVAGGSSVSGTNVQLYDSNSTAAQQWSFSQVTMPLSSGIYTISTSLSSSKVLDVAGGSMLSGGNIQIYDSNGTSAQKFIVTDDGSGYYTVRNLGSRKVLDVTGGSTANGANVQQYTANGTAAQKWKFVAQSDGTYSIVAACGKYLDVTSGSSANGTNVQIYEGNGSAAQKWNLEEVKLTAPSDGLYTISSALDDTKVIDVAGGSWSNGTNIQIWSSTESASKTNQQYRLISDGSGWYTIQNAATGKVLDVAGAISADGTNVQLYEPNGTNAQKWQIVSSNDGMGSYYIVSSLGKYLDITGGMTANGTNVEIYTGNQTKAQKFYFTGTSFNGNGWYSTDMHSRSYYTGGNVKTGWNKIGNNWYYFDGSGKMQYSTVIGTNRLKEDGTMATLTTVFENVQPGKRTVKNLLQNAMLACGRTLYIWGGGWDSSDTQKIGYYPSWENFFLANGTASYNRHNFENSYGSGLDCSGFMAWVIYNTMYTSNGQINLLEEDGSYYNSTLLATRLSALKWAYLGKSSSTSALKAGDVVSMTGHVWMVIGVCSDGSVVLVHSSPAGSATGGGVQISGTSNNAGEADSEAYRLAKQYMDKYFFEWPFGTASVSSSYLNYNNFADWNTLSGVITDPDGYKNMSAAEVLKDLFGE